MEFCCKYPLNQLKTLSYHISRVSKEYMIATPKPFVFYFKHHVMIMVSIVKGADLRTLQKYPRTKK